MSLSEKKLSDSNLPECCLMSAIFRGSQLMIPHGDDVIQKDDRVVIVGKPEAIEGTRKLFEETKKNFKNVIARADRPDYAELFEIVGVDVAISPIQAAVNEVLKFTMGIGIESLVTIEGEKGKIIELTAKHGSKILNKKLKDVHFPRGAIVSAIVRGMEVIIPGGSHIILPDDKVVIFFFSRYLNLHRN